MGLILCDCAKREDTQTGTTLKEKMSTISTPEDNLVIPLSKVELQKSRRLLHSRRSNTQSFLSETFFSIDKAVIIGKGSGSIKDIYSIGRRIGGGAYGEVYLAEHKKKKEKVAIKLIKKRKESSTWIRDDIIREIEVLKTLDHQNIVKIFEFYEGMGNYYIVQEFCNGGNLFDKVFKEGAQTEIFSALIMFQLFSAINYCHIRKIIHRDLKPENIMLEDKTKYGNPCVKIIDFGTAKFHQSEYENEIIGTPYYIAPEVLNKNYTNKCDIWSLGVILYVLTKGKFPFGGEDSKEIYSNILKGKYDIESTSFNKKSKELIDLIKKLLKYKPEERISAEEALNHPWFKKLKIKEKLSDLSTTQMRNLLTNIKNYYPDKVLQQASIAYLVHNHPQIEEVHNAASLYLKIDKNNDGIIVRDEFIKGLQYLFKEQNDNVDKQFINDLFDIIDADGSAGIEYEEFIRAACDKKKFLDEKVLHFAFDYFDKDKNGIIALSEIKNVFNQEIEIPEDDFQTVIDEVDINHDGIIDFEEFKIMMKKILF